MFQVLCRSQYHHWQTKINDEMVIALVKEAKQILDYIEYGEVQLSQEENLCETPH